MKKTVCLLMVLVLAISQGVCAQETAKGPVTGAKELSPEQFWEEFVIVVQASDAERIQQLFTDNPTTAEQIQQRFTELGKGTTENAEQYRAFAEILGKFRSNDFSYILDMSQEQGEYAYYASDYTSALGKWQLGLKQARGLNNKPYISHFLGNLGIMYDKLGQYARALEYFEQALAITSEIGNRHGEGNDLSRLGLVYRNLGQYQDASTAFQKSLSIYEALGPVDSLWRTQRGLASVEVHLDQPESAIILYEQALDAIKALRAGLRKKNRSSRSCRTNSSSMMN